MPDWNYSGSSSLRPRLLLLYLLRWSATSQRCSVNRIIGTEPHNVFCPPSSSFVSCLRTNIFSPLRVIYFFSYWFIPLAFCCSSGSVSSRRSWKFHLNSSGPPPLFPLQESAAFLFAVRTAEQRRGAASEDAPAALLRSSRGAGFLPDIAEGGFFFFFLSGRLDDPLGEFLSCVLMGYNKVKM